MKNYGRDEFKQKLDLFLCKIPDEPKVQVLTPAALTPEAKASNSLLFQVDWARRNPGDEQEPWRLITWGVD